VSYNIENRNYSLGMWSYVACCPSAEHSGKKGKVKVRPCTGIEALYRSYGP